jgi:hypothetical protein
MPAAPSRSRRPPAARGSSVYVYVIAPYPLSSACAIDYGRVEGKTPIDAHLSGSNADARANQLCALTRRRGV